MIYPRADLFDLCKVADATFWPMHRQELSRTVGGSTQAKDLGPALWRASFTTAPALRGDAAAIEAALITLNGSAGSFLAYDVRRPFPAAHPGGYAGAISVSALYPADAFSIQLSAAAGGLSLRPGDYISFEYGPRPSRALHMIQAAQNIVGAGSAKKFSVFPALRPGVTVGAAVTVNRAPCEMILEPGQSPPSLRDLVASSVSFSAVQIF
ncbi:hypothetical protein SAMN05444149_108106 [Pseudosulfitobacter pseudonitzschiae]|uniref:Uncharacterized protein n=1 Tax=Pseudosulfitobacter pseudonitzschiae TaxID=1402135 RepID=A0A073IUH9_9RHOB|nr:hypothetical protein [Pseudosulfitobacter pseudonitzschiae]KEJ93988.1 hypothetical protein SUH3_12010 [Pseudosulfitobacter pseudonitzschiae]SHG01819.1 hypothetical protein SAMN05444149_108106 [Pseudosulfitobacter pseudonitzschiae]